MIVTATQLTHDSKSILDRVVQVGETIEIQQQGKTVAIIHPKVGASRDEAMELLSGRNFSQTDSQELQAAMDAASDVVGYAGRD